MAEERLQKILSRSGYGSRRQCEKIIAAGRVVVNGATARLGSKADLLTDDILVDGQAIKGAEPKVYIALYKPRGVISAVNPQDDRKTVRDLVDVAEQIYPVGRLDFDSEGLMLMTNDGELTNLLTHPRYGHEKEYRVLVARRPDDEQLGKWRRGIVLPDGIRSATAKVAIEAYAGKGTWLRITMKEGRKRQIRETGSLIGLPVVKIIRIRISSLQIGSLKPRQWRFLSGHEVDNLRRSLKSTKQ